MWRPVLTFTLLGVALFAADRLWWSVAPPPPVVIEAARVERLRDDLTRMLRRPPSREELSRAVAPEVDDELLYREALARGYADDDPVVFRRLVQNLRFAGADEDRDDVSLYEEARALGMHETDTVVRRRLVQRMRLDLEAGAGDAPEEDALRAWYERHPDLYRSPARARFFQLFFDREHEDRAADELARLRAEGASPEDARDLGDAFLLGAEQPSQSRREVADRFGAPFAEGVFGATPGQWSDPIASAYGVHLVWVYEREPQRPQPLEAVRDIVRHAVVAERRREALERALAALREGVEVVVEWPSEAS